MAKEKETAIVEAPKKTFSDIVLAELEKRNNALPLGLNKERFVTNAIALIQDKPDIAKYGQAQILPNLVKGAMLNLDFFNNEAYLVPYGNQLTFSTGYIGAIKLCKLYSERPIKEIFAKLVRSGDEFEMWSDNDGQHYSYKQKPFNDGAIIGAFAVAEFSDGGVLIDTMSLAELENTRKQSKAQNSPAWKNFTGEMYKKCVLHRLCKGITLNFENPAQKSIFMEDSEIEVSEKEETPDVIDVFEGEVVDE